MTNPTTSAQAPTELPGSVTELLTEVEDFTLSFDHPAYYALLRHMKQTRRSPGHARPAVVVDDWRALLERPNDFRGEAVTIEGVVGRNKDPYTHAKHPELGQVWQVELHRHDQPLACTVVFTNDVSDLPVGGTIRVTGYFLQIRNYLDRRGNPHQAALLLAAGPTHVSQQAPAGWRDGGDAKWPWIVGAATFGLLIVVVLMRRSAGRGGRTDPARLHAAHRAPVNLSEDLEHWAQDELPEPPDADDYANRS